MKNIFSILIVSLTIGCTMVSCYPKSDVPAASANGLNFSHYVAIGNSITSGYADGALYYAGQQVSYCNLLAQQLKLVGGGDFKQPLVPQNSVGVGSTGSPKLILSFAADSKGVVSLGPVPAAAQGDMSIFTTSVAAQGPFNNMGVPGAKAITVPFAGYGNPANGAGNYNPFFTRMTSDPVHASMLSDAIAQNPTFFSLFIGNNDVLLYAISGGLGDVITPTPQFNASIDAIVTQLLTKTTKGVIANVPDITSLPYFTTVPYNGLALTRQGQVDSLNAGYNGTGITFHLGANPFIIQDASVPVLGFRPMQQGEFVLLSVPQDSIKYYGYGSMRPIPAKYVLTTSKIAAVQKATSDYNTKLKAVADANGLAFVDANAFLANVAKSKTGLVYNGVTLTPTFVSGGVFSLDGIHLTPIGNALLTNEFIKAINAKYGSTIPQVNATGYTGVRFPANMPH